MTSDAGSRTRDDVYRDILAYGLLHIRDAAYARDSHVCEIEADHLHNIPSLIGEANELRHLCYYENERTLYLDRISAQDSSVAVRVRFTLARYRDLWAELKCHGRRNKNEP